MGRIPPNIAEFLEGRRIAVAGVSRQPHQAANAVFRKLRAAGYDVFPINPNAHEVEGVTCFPTIDAIGGAVDGVVIATHPNAALELVGQCAASGVSRVWFHRSFGQGSISPEAVEACARHAISCIAGGCPLMFCEPVDFAHRCMRWWLQRRHRVPS